MLVFLRMYRIAVIFIVTYLVNSGIIGIDILALLGLFTVGDFEMRGWLDIHSWLKNGALISAQDGKLLLGWGRRKWLPNLYESRETPCFYFPDYFLQNNLKWFSHEYTENINRETLINELNSLKVPLPVPFKWECVSASSFSKTFEMLQKKFRKNQLKKAVPFVFQTANQTMSHEQLHTSIKKALAIMQNRNLFLYGFWGEGEGMLGLTPEILFSFKDPLRFGTMACAGTKDNDANGIDLLNDPKELKEHRLVVQGIRESLAEYGHVSQGQTQLIVLPKLTHLLTPISVDCQHEPDFESLVKALHPTPALGAFPKKAGMEWLKEYHQIIDRRRFGAPAGYFCPITRNHQCYVAIRNIQWDQQQMFMGAGCGVIAESQLDCEWNEIHLKLQSIREALAI